MQTGASVPDGGSKPPSGIDGFQANNPDVSDRQWRGPAADDLLWLESGGEAVVFDCRSAQTHLLNSQAAAALRIVMRAPTDAAGLARALAQADLAAAEDRKLATDIMVVFDKLGLIEPVEL